ncbi:MAG: HAD hydrolase-like protein, partial [Clostridia bacterium]|nr:HAD hydrolase-like protein [Clostridia bacterium]
SQCYMVGDRWSDMAAGGKMGMQLIPVMTGRGHEAMNEDREKWQEYDPVYIAEDLLDAAKWIIGQLHRKEQ